MIPANEQFDNDSFPVSEETVLSPGKLSSNFALTQTMPSGKSSLPFLKALYPDESIGWGYLWTLNNRTSHWTGSLSGMADKAVQMSESEQVYFGVCRTGEKGDEYQRATAETVRYVPGVYVDIDTSEKHQRNNGKKSDENLPTIAESTTALESMPFKPSIIIDTGGGLHVYWLFHELVEIDSDKERTQIQAILKGWESLLRSHLKGKELDHVADLPRILRIPGTINHKYGTEVKLIKPVSTEPLDSIPRYELEDFAEFIRPIEKHDSKTPVECSPAENLKDIASVTEALSRLPVKLADDYDQWLKIGMICHAVGNCLFPIWEQWSQQSEKYEPGECAEKWESFKTERNDKLGIGSLIHLANEHAPKQKQSDNPEAITQQRKIPFHPFPVDCLSKELADYTCGVADSIDCDESFVAMPLLSVLAAAIGGSRIVEIVPGFTQPAILWTAIIAESGSGKSPAYNAVLAPYYQIEQARHDFHAEECERIRCSHEEWDSKDKSSEPDYPPLPRFCISDTTIEALAPVLKENPQGVLLGADELSGWLTGMNQYKGKGADRSHWLTLYDGNRLTIDRKTGPIKLIIVPRGIVSITGGIQPGVLRRALSDDDFDSGLPARFIFAMPPDKPIGWSDTPAPDSSRYETLLKRLIEQRGAEPLTIPFSEESRSLLRDVRNEDKTRLLGIPGPLRAAWAKAAGRIARLALILHCCEPFEEQEIQAETTRRAIKLNRWFDRETERIYQALGLSLTANADLLKLIGEKKEVTPRDVHRWKTSRYPNIELAEKELYRLQHDGILSKHLIKTSGRPKTVFRLNRTIELSDK